MNKENYMELALTRADVTMEQGFGGPFGAVVVKDGEVLSVESNTVLRDNDPTAHAEINAIRKACKLLGTYDLSGCELYATGYPCPMCLSAIMWAGIKKVYFAEDIYAAANIGFIDQFIYDWIDDPNSEALELEHLPINGSKQLYDRYVKSHNVIY